MKTSMPRLWKALTPELPADLEQRFGYGLEETVSVLEAGLHGNEATGGAKDAGPWAMFRCRFGFLLALPMVSPERVASIFHNRSRKSRTGWRSRGSSATVPLPSARRLP